MLPAERRTETGAEAHIHSPSFAGLGFKMSDFSVPTRLDDVKKEAHQIRSRLAALSEMERHLLHVSDTIQRASAQPLIHHINFKKPN